MRCSATTTLTFRISNHKARETTVHVLGKNPATTKPASTNQALGIAPQYRTREQTKSRHGGTRPKGDEEGDGRGTEEHRARTDSRYAKAAARASGAERQSITAEIAAAAEAAAAAAGSAAIFGQILFATAVGELGGRCCC